MSYVEFVGMTYNE